MATNKEIAENILSAVGGSANITNTAHCMTRLRLNLRDESIPKDDEVKSIPGVLGVVRSGGQYQIVIGPNVPNVFEEVNKLGSFGQGTSAKDDAPAAKEPLTAKKVGKSIMNYMAGCMTPMIPVMLAGGLFSSANAIFGPGLLGLYGTESDIYILFQMLYNAAYYFMPIMIGFNGAKLLGVNQLLGAYTGAILIAPALIDMVNTGASFTALGIPVIVNNYSQTAVPAMLCVAAMALIYKIVKKYMPDILTTVFTPFLTMFITTPLALCLLAPLGTIIGNAISGGLAAFGTSTGFLGVAVIAALWEFLVMTGMHMALMMPMMASFFETGVGTGPLNSGNFATWACFGVALGAFLRLRKREDKSTALGFFVSGLVGGITEPTLYGLCLKYTRCFIGLVVGGFVGGAYAGMVDLKGYMMTSPNFLSLLGFTGGTTINMVHGVVSSVLAMVVAAVLTYMFGFTKKDLEG